MHRSEKLAAAARLAVLLRDSYLAAYVRIDPHHDAPGWSDLSRLQRGYWTEVALELLDRGVMPPPLTEGD
jgi:hypothetical protein